MQKNERVDTADKTISIGIYVNGALMLFNLAIGYWWKSDAVFANGVECASDVMIIFTTMIALRIGRKTFDEQHPYGHGRAESLSAFLLSLLITVTGIWILYDSVRSTISGEFKSPGWPAVAAAVITVISMEWLSIYSRKSGDKIGSPALLALAKDFRKDAISAVSTLVGVLGTFLGFGAMDPLAAAVTSLFIIHIGYETFRDASHDLMDGSAPPDFISEVTRLAESVPGVEHVHDIRGRRSGQYMIIDLKLEMAPSMTVKESHDVATAVKKLIFEGFPNVGDVMIHVNPHEEEHIDLIRL
jgi:cation diffusion facilitator family transporter